MASASPPHARFDRSHPHFTNSTAAGPAATTLKDAIKLDLETLQVRLRQIVVEHKQPSRVVPALLDVALELINAHRVQYVALTAADELSTVESVGAEPSSSQHDKVNANTALTAIRERRVAVSRSSELVILAVPVDASGNGTDAIVADVTMRYGEVEPLVVSLQLVAAHVTLAHLHQRTDHLNLESQLACGLAEVIGTVQSQTELEAAGFVTATKLRDLLSGAQIAVGLRKQSTRIKLLAVSGHPEFDARGEISGLIENAMAEARLNDREITIWPPTIESERAATLCHQKLTDASQQTSTWSVLLKTTAGRVVGVLTVMGEDSDRRDQELAFLRTAAPLLANTLETVGRLRGGPVRRLVRRVFGPQPFSRASCLAVACVTVAVLLALPVQHRLKCEAVVQPASRRFAVAPYAGVLKQAVAKPGDLVRTNDVLAVMDDRELKWELAGLVADRDRAAKQRDSKLASKQVADMQMAQLEMQRLQLTIALLEHRKMNLKIRSPVDGVIIRGDLKDAEGAPVESGQSLFEVAPLDDLRFDVAIPDHDISFAHHGMHVEVSLEALPGRVLKGTVERLHPRAEIHEAENVFIAEVALDAEEDALRPGMKGQARLLGSRRSLGWILFHRPWYRLVNYVR